MTPLPSARKRAEDFADAVDALVAGLAPRSVPATVATSPLLGVVAALRAVPEPAPRPEFTDALRRRLLTEAAASLPTAPAALPAAAPGRRAAPLPGRRPGRLVAAATAFVVVGGTAGVASAAQRAVPGDALYPVKRALEGAEFRLSTSDGGRGRDLLEQAGSRLQEVEALLPATADAGAVPAGVAARLPVTLDAFTGQALEGSGLLLGSYERDQDPRDVVDVRAFAAASTTTLTALAATAPSDVRDELAGAATAMQAVDARAVALCPTCGDGSPALQVPDDLTATPADGDVAVGADDTSASPADAASPSDGASSVGPGDATDGPPTASDAPSDGASTPGDDGSASEGPDPTDGGATDGPTDAPDPTDGATDGPTDATDGVTDGVTEVPTDPVTPPSPTQDPTVEPDDPVDEGVPGGGTKNSGDDPGDHSGSAGPGGGGASASGGTPGHTPGGGGGAQGPGTSDPSGADVTDAVDAATGPAGGRGGLPRLP